MNRTFTILGILFFIFLAYAGYAWTLADTYASRFWLHRCNSLEKLQEQSGSFTNFETDVCIRHDGAIDVTHDVDTSFGLSIEPFLQYLGINHNSHMWVDVKNLNENNQAFFITQLDSIRNCCGVSKEQLIIESTEWHLLNPLTTQGYYTSCSIPSSTDRLTEEETDSILNLIDDAVHSGEVRAISFHSSWYDKVRDRYDTDSIDFLTWQHESNRFTFMLRPLGITIAKDHRIKAILVTKKGKYHR